MVMQHPDTGALSSTCVWAEGVETYLVRTTRICFVRGDPNGWWDWDRVLVEAAGDLMTPLDMYP